MSSNDFEDFDENWADDFDLDDDLGADGEGDGEDYVSPLSSGVVSEDEEDADEDDLSDIFDEVESIDTDTDLVADEFDAVDDEFNLDSEDEVVVAEPITEAGTSVALRGELVGDEIVITDSERQLTHDEARYLTDNIRSTSEMLYTLVSRAYTGKAWIPLGYTSFKEYMTYEFDISVSKAYSLINQASVIEALEAATPAGTRISINQSSAKKLKKVIDDLVPEIEEATEYMGPREAADYVEQRVQEVTSSQRHGAPPGGYEDDYADNERGGGSGGGGGTGGGGGGGGYGGGFDNPNDFDAFPNVNLAGDGEARRANGEDVDVDDFDIDLSDIDLDFGDIDELDDDSAEGDKEKIATDFKSKVESTYKFYSAIVSLEEMPDVDEIIESIPESRKDQIDTSLKTVMAWLGEFESKWKTKMETFENSADNSLESDAETEFDGDDTEFDGDDAVDFGDDDDFEDFTDKEDAEDEDFTDNDSE